MSRQRLRESSVKWQINLTKESFSLKILKLLELKTIENKSKKISLVVNESVKNYMDNNFVDNLNYFKKKNKVDLLLEINANYEISEYSIEFKLKSGKLIEKIENISELKKKNVMKDTKDEKKIIKFKRKLSIEESFIKKKN